MSDDTTSAAAELLADLDRIHRGLDRAANMIIERLWELKCARDDLLSLIAQAARDE